MLPFTLENLIGEVRKLAQENPDNAYKCKDGRYVMCYYSKKTCTNGSIGCIFGQAMKRLGLDDNILATMENNTIMEIIPKYYPEHNRRLAIWCREVQSAQDFGWIWSKCIEAADDYIKNLGT